MRRKLHIELPRIRGVPSCSLASLAWQAVLILLCSCSLGPKVPPLAPPSEALEAAVEAANGDPSMELTDYIPEKWWTLFEDPQLDTLIETTLVQNPTLQAAEAKILQASAIADSFRANLYPFLIGGGDVSRQKLSQTALIPFDSENNPISTPGGSDLPVPAGFNGIPVYFTQWETELQLSYQFDFWGKNRNAVAAALGEVQARVADEAFLRLQLAVAVAQTYFQLQIDYARREVAQTLLENRRKYSELTQQRVRGNLNATQTKSAAHANITTAEQALLVIDGDIPVRENQLKAYLAGDFTEQFSSSQILVRPLPRVPLPSDLPVHLLSRRPDIISQLWLIESAERRIEVARAGFYPDFNLAAFLGYQTIHLHKLFWGKSAFFNVDPAFTLPIFEGGRLVANLRESEIESNLAILQYNTLVINAAKEVLDGMAVLRNLEQQLEEVKKTTRDQEEIFKITQLRIQHHLDSNLNYLNDEENLLRAKDQELIVLGNKIQAILLLIKALGGGFDVCQQLPLKK